jgi:hypothetical protein
LRLEPDEGKLSRPVLRGGSGSNAAPLPDVRHEVARTVVCYGYFINKPAVPSVESIGTGATGNGQVGSCRDNVPHPSGCGNGREDISAAASVKVVGGLD